MTRYDDAQLQAMTRLADPLADDTITAIIGPWEGTTSPGTDGLARLAQATRLISQWRTNAGLAQWQPDAGDADPQVVAALQLFLRTACHLPEWADPALIEQAEDVFTAEGPQSCVLLFCASLPECYVPPPLAGVLHVAGQLEAHTEHRIRQTAAMVFPVMLKGGLTTGDGAGIAQILKVRLIHATIRHLILHGPPAESAQDIPAGQTDAQGSSTSTTHHGLHQALLARGWDVTTLGLPCNQLELAYTLLTFHYVVLRGMRTLGLALQPQQEKAYLHAWNVAGHVLGVDSSLMASEYDEATVLFARMKRIASATDVLPDSRPALAHALMRAMAGSIRLPLLRSFPVPMTQWLVGPETSRAIGLDEAVAWPVQLAFTFTRAATWTVDQLVRLVLPQFSLSRMFTRMIGYHLLHRFLISQTRPLALPQEVLDPMHAAIADWHADPRSPGWLNRLEDRLTTKGEWVPFARTHSSAKAGSA